MLLSEILLQFGYIDAEKTAAKLMFERNPTVEAGIRYRNRKHDSPLRKISGCGGNTESDSHSRNAQPDLSSGHIHLSSRDISDCSVA
jgi:hypothetical protein